MTQTDYRAQVAKEVAARYGVICQPEAVHIVELGRTCETEWVWNGSALVAKELQAPGDLIRPKIDAKWRRVNQGRRLAQARQAEAQQAQEPKPRRRFSGPPTKIMEAAARRLEAVRAFAATGKTIPEIAKFMGVSEKGAYKYCVERGVAFARREQAAPVKKSLDDIRTKFAPMAATMTSRQIAEATGMTQKQVQQRLNLIGVRAQLPAQLVKQRKNTRAKMDAKQAAVAARRQKIAEMFRAGLTDQQMAEALGVTVKLVAIDRARSGLVREPKRKAPVEKVNGMDLIRQKRDQRDIKIRDLRANGMTLGQIAEALDCSLNTVTTSLQRMGMTMLGFRGKVGDVETLGRVEAMLSRGLGVPEIAEAIDTDRPTVRRIINRIAKLKANRQEAA